MNLSAFLPDWLASSSLPWWAQLGAVLLALMFAVALLAMPFAVFGLKGRLDLLEAQLDDIQADLRVIAMRLGDTEPETRLPMRDLPPRPHSEERSEPRLRRP